MAEVNLFWFENSGQISVLGKGMLHLGLKIKKLNNVSNFKSVVF